MVLYGTQLMYLINDSGFLSKGGRTLVLQVKVQQHARFAYFLRKEQI